MEFKWLVWLLSIWLTSPCLIKEEFFYGKHPGCPPCSGWRDASRDGATEAFTTDGILNRPKSYNRWVCVKWKDSSVNWTKHNNSAIWMILIKFFQHCETCCLRCTDDFSLFGQHVNYSCGNQNSIDYIATHKQHADKVLICWQMSLLVFAWYQTHMFLLLH